MLSAGENSAHNRQPKRNQEYIALASQDIILCDVNEKDKDAIIKEFARFHVNPLSPAKAYDRAMACVALPTCGLAISESERMLGATTEIMNKVYSTSHLPNENLVVTSPGGCVSKFREICRGRMVLWISAFFSRTLERPVSF